MFKLFYLLCDNILNFFFTYNDFWDPVTTFFVLDFNFIFTPVGITDNFTFSPNWGLDFLAGLTVTLHLVTVLSYVYMLSFTAFNFLLRFFYNSFNNFVYFDFDYLILFDSNIFSFFFFIFLGFFFLKSFFYILIYNSNFFFFCFWIFIVYILFFFRNDLLFSDKSYKFNIDYVLLLKEYLNKTKTFRSFLLKYKKYK